MLFQVSEEIRQSADRCIQNQSCLSEKGRGLCEVESLLSDRMLFVKPEDKCAYCNYSLRYGHSTICSCPVRGELYRRYNV